MSSVDNEIRKQGNKMSIFKWMGSFVVAGLWVAGAACDSAQSIETTIEDKATVVESAPPVEREATCEEIVSYFNKNVSADQVFRGSCTFQGLFVEAASEGAVACAGVVDECLQGSPQGMEPVLDCQSDPFAGCSARLEEIEACVFESVTTMKKLASLTCSSSLESISQLNTQACDRLEEKCPGLVSGGGEFEFDDDDNDFDDNDFDDNDFDFDFEF